MFESLIAKMVFNRLLSRPDISKAYKMVGPEDSWYNTIKKVHESLAQIQELPHTQLKITIRAVYPHLFLNTVKHFLEGGIFVPPSFCIY